MEIWNKDCFGNNLQIGDTVVGISQTYFSPSLRKGVITEIKNITKTKSRFVINEEVVFLKVQKYKVLWLENHNRFSDCEKYCPKNSIVLADQLLKI